MANHTNMKLGKKPYRHDPSTLRFEAYFDPAALPFIPPCKEWMRAMPPKTGMMLNDTLGDCVIAAFGHQVQAWTFNATGKMITIPDQAILQGYEAVGGYQPGKPWTDQGCEILHMLKYARTTGIGGHAIGAFASINPQNAEHLRAAVYLFGGVNLGLALPASAQRQDVWRVHDWSLSGDAAPGSWGGHSVALLDMAVHMEAVDTWGQKKLARHSFRRAYCDEAWVMFSEDFLSNDKSPLGFDKATLLRDLALVTAG